MSQFLTQQELQRVAPSVFTSEAHENTSARYQHISTAEVLKGLEQVGFGVTRATETRVRDSNLSGYAKHMLRLRKHGEKEVNGLFPEIVLINSHDGKSSYQLRAGIYRLVCSNGMMACDELMFQKVRHQGDVVQLVVDSCEQIVEIFPQTIQRAKRWSEIQLTDNQALLYADAAKSLKWDDGSNVEVDAQQVLRRRRPYDRGGDLWTTFNVVQENIIKGGIVSRNKETRERRKTRGVKSVNEDTRLNTALWKLTEHMASLVQ